MRRVSRGVTQLPSLPQAQDSRAGEGHGLSTPGPAGLLGAVVPACQAMAPVIDELAPDLAGKLKVAKLNVDEDPEGQEAWGFGAFRLFSCIEMVNASANWSGRPHARRSQRRGFAGAPSARAEGEAKVPTGYPRRRSLRRAEEHGSPRVVPAADVNSIARGAGRVRGLIAR